MDLREWGWGGGDIVINKLAFALDERHPLTSKQHISPAGCTRTCHSHCVLGDNCSCPSVS
jgi:hypothetical protein